jgi:hypothetical protein
LDFGRLRTTRPADELPDVADERRGAVMKDFKLEGGDVTRTRKRQGLVGAALVGLIAAALIVGPHWFGRSPVSDSAKEPGGKAATSSVETSAVDPIANPCPAKPVRVSDPSKAGTTIPADAVMVRLCRARVGPVTSAWEEPAEGLRNVDAFVTQVARLPQAPVNPCPLVKVIPAPFALHITDSAGRTRTLSSSLTQCGTVTVNTDRVAADALLRLYRESLMQQRKTATTSDSGTSTPP